MTRAGLARFVDRFTIEYVRDYPHPIERVWRSVADPAEISVWFWTARFEARVGAPYKFGGDESDMFGVVTAVEPPRLLRFGGPHGHGPTGYIQFELAPVSGGTRLTFTQHSQPGFFRKDEWPIDPPDLAEGPGMPWRPGTLSGWHGALDCLGGHMDGADIETGLEAAEAQLLAIYREHMRTIPPT
ncbi:SRPBCC domain-containing protein [Phenylobacterium sp.]|uniref:SRPBCC domain-containing protein n=1 Tax=Phenylobacterium sp. TaxID=1871053 RepID=UPI0030F40909